MKRTTIYLDPELESRLKAESLGSRRPMAELIREAVLTYLVPTDPGPPPGAGRFASGRSDTATRFDEELVATGFGAGGFGVDR